MSDYKMFQLPASIKLHLIQITCDFVHDNLAEFLEVFQTSHSAHFDNMPLLFPINKKKQQWTKKCHVRIS